MLMCESSGCLSAMDAVGSIGDSVGSGLSWGRIDTAEEHRAEAL